MEFDPIEAGFGLGCDFGGDGGGVVVKAPVMVVAED